MDANIDTLATQFAALGEPTRLAIMTCLMRDGPQSAGALGNVAEISPPAMSRHLKVLRQAGLVSRSVNGQQRIYALEPQGLRAIAQWSMEAEMFWTRNLDRLARHLGAER